MTTKVLKDNGQLIHVSTLRPLTQDKQDNPDEIADHETFVQRLTQKLGKPFDPTDLPNDIIMPDHELSTLT